MKLKIFKPLFQIFYFQLKRKVNDIVNTLLNRDCLLINKWTESKMNINQNGILKIRNLEISKLNGCIN